MSHRIRRALVPVVMVVVWFVSGCSGASSDSGAVGTSGQVDAIGVQVSSGFVTVENRTERSLLETRIAIRSGTLQYVAQLPGLGPGVKRDLSLRDFKAPDAAPINVNFRRPSEILVTATDVDGKKYELKVPWKQ